MTETNSQYIVLDSNDEALGLVMGVYSHLNEAKFAVEKLLFHRTFYAGYTIQEWRESALMRDYSLVKTPDDVLYWYDGSNFVEATGGIK